MSRVNTENHLYRHYDADDNLLYVGISINALKRLKQHNKKAKWFDDISKVTIEKFPDRESVEQAEIRAIKTEKPKFNIKHTHNQKKYAELKQNFLKQRLENCMY